MPKSNRPNRKKHRTVRWGSKPTPPGASKLLTGKVVLRARSDLALEHSGGSIEVLARREVPVIPGDRIQARLHGDKHGQRAVPVKVLRAGSAQLLGRLRPGKEGKDGAQWVDFDRWKLPALHPPKSFKGKADSGIVEASLARDSSGLLYIERLRQIPPAPAEQRIYQWAMARFGVRGDFPAEALGECRHLNADRLDKEARARQGAEECLAMPFVTIDGEDARDFDDAVYARPKGDGYELYVAIADVSHFVPPGSALDKEAEARGSSVYFPGMAVPMLPPRLCDDLCSLVPGKLRLAMVCAMRLDARGSLVDHRFIETAIRSRARLSYTEANRFIEDESALPKLDPKAQDSLRTLYRLYRAIIDQPRQRLALDMPSFSFKLDSQNHPVSSQRQCRGEAEKLIEEMMVMANTACALSLCRHAQSLGLFRVHPQPPQKSIDEAREQFLARFPSAALRRDKGVFPQCAQLAQESGSEWLSLLLVRQLGAAGYRSELGGHFGLDLTHYAHFTSPIRRYPDLVNHRLIKLINGSESGPAKTALGRLAIAINARLRANDKAMYYQNDLMGMMLCEPLVGQRMEGVVDNLMPFGAYVHLPQLGLSGLMHRTTMNGYSFDYARGHFVSRPRSGTPILQGCEVLVQLDAVDLYNTTLELSFVRITNPSGFGEGIKDG